MNVDLNKRSEEIEAALRDVGLYVDSMRWIDPKSGNETFGEDEGDTVDAEDSERKGAKKTSYVVVINCYLGDVAFSSRVQNPEQYDIDSEFAVMANELRRDNFKTNQQSILEDLDRLTNRES